jgi:hypothetical protein
MRKLLLLVTLFTLASATPAAGQDAAQEQAATAAATPQLVLDATAPATEPVDDDSAAPAPAESVSVPSTVTTVVDVPQVTDQSLPDAVTSVGTYMSQGKYGLAASVLLMLGLWAWRKWGWKLDKVPAKYMPWISVGLAVAAHAAAAVAQKTDILAALVQGVLVGTGASGAWGLTGLVRKK